MAACKAAGGAVVVMTHRPPGAIANCDRLMVLEDGPVAAYGPRDEVLRSMVRERRGYQPDLRGCGKSMKVRRKIWRAWPPLSVGFLTIAVMAATVAIWGLRTQIAGAVVAGGTVRVESNRQVIQHPDGGVVGEILARDGDQVSSGQVLVRFDGTFLRSELSVVERQLFEIHARKGAARGRAGGPRGCRFRTLDIRRAFRRGLATGPDRRAGCAF